MKKNEQPTDDKEFTGDFSAVDESLNEEIEVLGTDKQVSSHSEQEGISLGELELSLGEIKIEGLVEKSEGDFSSEALLDESRSAEAVYISREEELASFQTLEDTWDGEIREEQKAGVLTKWTSVILIIGVIVGCGWALWMVSNDKTDERSLKLEQVRENKKAIQLTHKETAREIAKIQKVFNGYIESDNAESRLNFFYYPEELSEQASSFVQDSIENPKIMKGDPVNVERVVEELVGDQRYWTLIYSYGLGDHKRQKLMFLRKTNDGSYKIDWETYASYLKPEVDAAIKNRSTDVIELKAQVIPSYTDGQYNWGFTDDLHRAYRLELSDGRVLWGYVPQSNLFLNKELLEINESQYAYVKVFPSIRMEMVLSVSFPKDNHELNTQCVHINEVLSGFALYPKTKTDE